MNMVLIGPDKLVEMEQETQVIKHLKEMWDRQKSYSYQHMEFKEFQVGENVQLCA